MTVASRWMTGLGGLLGLLSAPAWAGDVPVLDRVPAAAPIVVVIPHVGKLLAGIESVAKLGVPADELKALFALEGLNKESSAAAAILPGPDGKVDFEADAAPVVLLIPVTDFAKFVTDSGGDPAQAVAEVDPFDSGEPGFARNLGNGYAVLGQDRALVEAFKGDAGQSARHNALLGPVGRATVERAAVSVFVNVQALAPEIQTGLDKAKEQMQALGAMAGQGQEANIAFLDAMGLTLLRDGQSAVFAADAGETGIAFHWATQFKEGSPSAAKLQGKGSASALMDRLPTQPYLFAAALDTSLPGVKQMFKNVLDMAAKADPQNAEAMGLTAVWAKSIDTMDGASMLIGAPPTGLMGGLFANTVAYLKTKDAAGYAALMKNSMATMNGKTMQGFTYQTSYVPKSAATPADEWSMRMQADPNDPDAQQTMMAMAMVFGPEGGLGGFVAPAKDGVVVTYSKSTKLLEQSRASAETGGFTGEAGLKAVSGALPENRIAEAYIGVGPLLEAVQMFRAVQGMGGEAEIPKDLPPIGLGGSTESGGVRATLFAPKRVLDTISQMTGAGNADAAGQPRF